MECNYSSMPWTCTNNAHWRGCNLSSMPKVVKAATIHSQHQWRRSDHTALPWVIFRDRCEGLRLLLNMKTAFIDIGITMRKIRRSWQHVVSIIGIPIYNYDTVVILRWGPEVDWSVTITTSLTVFNDAKYASNFPVKEMPLRLLRLRWIEVVWYYRLKL